MECETFEYWLKDSVFKRETWPYYYISRSVDTGEALIKRKVRFSLQFFLENARKCKLLRSDSAKKITHVSITILYSFNFLFSLYISLTYIRLFYYSTFPHYMPYILRKRYALTPIV